MNRKNSKFQVPGSKSRKAQSIADGERIKILRREMRLLKAALRDGEKKLIHAWHAVQCGVAKQASRKLELYRMAGRLAELEK
jgi:hypothetical protein